LTRSIMFADDTQMYDHCLISNILTLVNNYIAYINDLQKSFASPSHLLQLNPTKAEFIWFGTCTTLSKIHVCAAYRSLPVGSAVVRETVCDLGVWFGSELCVKINKVVSIFMLLPSPSSTPTTALP